MKFNIHVAVGVIAATVLGVHMVQQVSGFEFGCAHCGHASQCNKVCRLVREDKKVEIVCWGCKEEDYCIPGHSKPGCKHCDTVCDACAAKVDSTGVCSQPKPFSWIDWIPGCATIHTKHKLMKRIEVKTIPSYKWVVEDLCPACEKKCTAATIAPGTAVPPAPQVQASFISGVSEPIGGRTDLRYQYRE